MVRIAPLGDGVHSRSSLDKVDDILDYDVSGMMIFHHLGNRIGKASLRRVCSHGPHVLNVSWTY